MDRYAIVVSRFNQTITERLLQGALRALKSHGVKESSVKVARVPGAFEIPLAARRLVRAGKYDAVICLGCILQGETRHNHYIASAVSKGIMDLMLDSGVPVTFGVLTPDTMRQALARSGRDSANKGTEAAEAALEMARLMRVP